MRRSACMHAGAEQRGSTISCAGKRARLAMRGRVQCLLNQGALLLLLLLLLGAYRGVKLLKRTLRAKQRPCWGVWRQSPVAAAPRHLLCAIFTGAYGGAPAQQGAYGGPAAAGACGPVWPCPGKQRHALSLSLSLSRWQCRGCITAAAGDW